MNSNHKKILCLNILSHNKCRYGDHCIYAHSLKEQNITPYNKKVYNIVTSDSDLKNFNLLKDIKLYKYLLKLTNICPQCQERKCPGGYNCKNGAISKKYVICHDDMVYNNCTNIGCDKIHLSKRGLVSFYEQKRKENAKNKKNSCIHKDPQLHGILLTEESIRSIVNNQSSSSQFHQFGYMGSVVPRVPKPDVLDKCTINSESLLDPENDKSSGDESVDILTSIIEN